MQSTERSAVVSEGTNNIVYEMDPEVLNRIFEEIGENAPEQGGALGIDKTTGRVSRFFYDAQGCHSAASYSPDTNSINDIIQAWDEEGIEFCGMIHSHPGKFACPSVGDYEYAAKIIHAMPTTLHGRLFMPIVTVDLPRAKAWIHPYAAVQEIDGNITIQRVQLSVQGKLLDGTVNLPFDVTYHNERDLVAVKESEFAMSNAHDKVKDTTSSLTPEDELFQRNTHVLPKERMARSTVVVVGCGGARGFCVSLARSRVHRIILIDGDVVSKSNVGTQDVYADEVGMFKTEVIANTLRRINPYMEIVEVRRFLDNTFNDEELASIIGENELAEHPENILLCGCTDNFPAQDRTVKLALKWGIPYLAAQTYAQGLGGEVVFTYPGVTAACPRCMLASRYAAYAHNAQNDVTSENAPIYVTDRLNALKTHVASMLLLYGSSSRIGNELDRVKDRNLILVSFSPDCEEELGITAFSRTFSELTEVNKGALPMEQTVWLKQKPDRPENGFPHCPYCAGVNDLRLLRGLNADTRKAYDLTQFIKAIQPIPLIAE